MKNCIKKNILKVITPKNIFGICISFALLLVNLNIGSNDID